MDKLSAVSPSDIGCKRLPVAVIVVLACRSCCFLFLCYRLFVFLLVTRRRNFVHISVFSFFFVLKRRSAWERSSLCSPTISTSRRTRYRCTRISRHRGRYRFVPHTTSHFWLSRPVSATSSSACFYSHWIMPSLFVERKTFWSATDSIGCLSSRVLSCWKMFWYA